MTTEFDSVPSSIPQPPPLQYFGTLHIEVAQPVEVGNTHDGQRRVISITGRSMAGQDNANEILHEGAETKVIRSATESDLDARYVMTFEVGEGLHQHNVAY